MSDTELIERLEAAEGPSRELFEQAAIICGIARTGKALRFGTLLMHDAWEQAALMLVPEGWWHEIKGPRKYLNIPTSSPNYYSCWITSYDCEKEAMGWGATPALAICIAALKAQGTDDE